MVLKTHMVESVLIKKNQIVHNLKNNTVRLLPRLLNEVFAYILVCIYRTTVGQLPPSTTVIAHKNIIAGFQQGYPVSKKLKKSIVS